jgi:pyridoxine 5-phosphate synthase
MSAARIRLGVNIDHVATLRNARGGPHPSPARAAAAAEEAGADNITLHIREDRRHVRESDLEEIAGAVRIPLNLEMAATAEMLAIALAARPHAVCLVPERREERTTEGGLDVAAEQGVLRGTVRTLVDAGMRVFLFIDPDPAQLEAALALGAHGVELHTGAFCHAADAGQEAAAQAEWARLAEAAAHAARLGLELHAGHGISYATAPRIAALPGLVEVNIGHFLIGEALFSGLGPVIARMHEALLRERAA